MAPGVPDWIVVGLGNPGDRYTETRHNAGFRVCDHLAQRHRAVFERTGDGLADVAEAEIDRNRVLLVKPLTFMNRSGTAVNALLRLYDSGDLSRLLIVYDDLDLPTGGIRVRSKGSAGGQKGMASIIEVIGSDAIGRVRIGIGRPPDGVSAPDYVLGVPLAEERELLLKGEVSAADAVETIISHGFNTAMNRFHIRRPVSGEPEA